MSVEVRALTAVPTQTVAALSAACLVAASAVVPAATAVHSVPVLTPPGITLTALPLPLDLVNQQVVFNVGLFVDWITTGAALIQRQTQVPGAFVSDLGAGVPPQTAVARALTAIADIEFEAGRDLIGYAQDIAVFQLQFRATTLSAFPPFDTGPGQQFVVDTTAFGLMVTQRLADFARAVVTSVEQFTHGALGTPLPTTTAAITPIAAAVANPKTSTVQRHSPVNTLSSTANALGDSDHQPKAGPGTKTADDSPKGHGPRTRSIQKHQSDGNATQGSGPKDKNHQSPNKGPHH